MLTNFVIIPKNYEDYDDVEKLKLAPKIDDKIMKNIAKKAGIQWDFMLDYFELQEVTTEVKETSKITITYDLISIIFNREISFIYSFNIFFFILFFRRFIYKINKSLS